MKSICRFPLLVLAFIAALLAIRPCASAATRPLVIPLPATVAGVAEEQISLDGTWKFTLTPPAGFHQNSVNPSSWADIAVPGEPWMLGFPVSFDVEYPYKRQIDIPSDFAGKRVFVRFDGVYSSARVWVNGQLAGTHIGGFTSWQLDITPFVTAGQSAWLTVGITDEYHDLSFGSGYAGRYLGVNNVPHRIGGILRDVTLFALPTTHLTRLHAVTDLDANYLNATLTLQMTAAFTGAESAAAVDFELTDPSGSAVALSPDQVAIDSASPEKSLSIPIAAPLKWDAEHPHLYTLTAKLRVGEEIVETVVRKIGFREIEMVGNRMLVNGREVKLRGGCRHSIHPLAGRADVPGLDETDVRLYKEANLNYIRTSHYPTTPRFLELCDVYGLYVEEEAAIVWVDHGAAQGVLAGYADDVSKQGLFVNAAAEMIERDQSHPCIIMWSLGNENVRWGPNFQAERDYARLADPTRPLKTGHNHYSGGWNTDSYLDLDSYHYPEWNSNFNKQGKPYLFDEYAHVMCYYGLGSMADLDPSYRNFWGESILRMWESIFLSSGSLGGAIWGTVDEVFLTPDAAIGYGPWGIFDGWRRLKPEYWLTKKAYSPVRIANTPLGNPGSGQPLSVPVKNWFDHTNFNELIITWEIGSESGSVSASIAPHATGTLTLPARDWQNDDVVRLRFEAVQPGYQYTVDEYDLLLTEPAMNFPAPQGPAPQLSQSAGEITITGSAFEIVFDKASGSIRSGTYGGQLLLTGGPELNLAPLALSAFSLSSITAQTQGSEVLVHLQGVHATIGISYQIRIDGAGLIRTTYTVTNPPANSASYSEVGVSFRLAQEIDRLDWDRKGLYTNYPDDHIGRTHGSTAKRRPGPVLAYRQEPGWPWALDMEDFLLHGKDHAGWGLTNDFRSAKETIRHASVIRSDSGERVRVESDGASHSVRVGVATDRTPVTDDRDPGLTYTGTWSPYEDPNDYLGTETFSNQAGASVEYAFTGTSVRWISARNSNLGKVDIYLDGALVAAAVDAYAPSKQVQQSLYQATGLADGPHTLKVVVRADKNPAAINNYALIDAFSAVPAGDSADPLLMLHVNRQWAYDALDWGNYERFSQISSGFSDTVSLRLMDGEPPTSGAFDLKVQVTTDALGDKISELIWNSAPLSFYEIQYSPDLGLWYQLESYLPSGGNVTRYTVDPVDFGGSLPARAFFRIREAH